MKGERLYSLQIDVYKEIYFPDGSRIILAEPMESTWAKVNLANHNVFRLDAQNRVVWQVMREDKNFYSFNFLWAQIEKPDLKREEFFDPFTHMSTQFFEIEEPSTHNANGLMLKSAKEIYFDDYKPGRLLWLTAHSWAYNLDPETGIATCTGEQVK